MDELSTLFKWREVVSNKSIRLGLSKCTLVHLTIPVDRSTQIKSHHSLPLFHILQKGLLYDQVADLYNLRVLSLFLCNC